MTLCLLERLVMFMACIHDFPWQEVKVVGVSSGVMSLAIEFIYTGQFTSTYEHFFELLLVANMYEMKELETQILRRLLQLISDRDAFIDLTGNFPVEKNRLIADFHVECEIQSECSAKYWLMTFSLMT